MKYTPSRTLLVATVALLVSCSASFKMGTGTGTGTDKTTKRGSSSEGGAAETKTAERQDADDGAAQSGESAVKQAVAEAASPTRSGETSGGSDGGDDESGSSAARFSPNVARRVSAGAGDSASSASSSSRSSRSGGEGDSGSSRSAARSDSGSSRSANRTESRSSRSAGSKGSGDGNATASSGQSGAGDSERASGGGASSASGQGSNSTSASAGDLECPRFLTISDPQMSSKVKLLRCDDETRIRHMDSRADAFNKARVRVRGQMNPANGNPPALHRATYVYLCDRLMQEEKNEFYPVMSINCTWHADHLDMNALRSDLAPLPPAEQKSIMEHAKKAAKRVRRVTKQKYPRERHQRDWEVFYDIRSRTLKQYRARKKRHADAYRAIASLEKGIRTGDLEGCAEPLRRQLSRYVGHPKSKEQAIEKMTDSVGYALTESLAKCHYFSNRARLAAGLKRILEGHRRVVAYHEQRYYAQLDALSKDYKKTEKMPHLRNGSRYASFEPDDLSEPDFPLSEVEENWKYARLDTDWSTSKGRVKRVQGAGNKKIIHFKRERVPVYDQKCRKTNRIKRIARDGTFIYYRECTPLRKVGMTWSAPDPIAVDYAGDINRGDYAKVARVLKKGDRVGYVVYAATGPGKSARPVQIADVPLR